MSRTTRTFALLASLLMLVSVAAPAAAIDDGSLSVSATQDDSGQVVITVEGVENNSTVGVEGATVTVDAVNNTTYADAGTYTSDENGTVTLSEPAEEVELEITAEFDNQTASTSLTVGPAGGDGNETDSFGLRVSSFVAELQSSNNTTDAPFGVLVANFVVANNPGNAPSHAGPPAWLVEGGEKEPGPPDHAGGNDSERGPPEDAGPDGDDEDGQGPPDHAGPDGDDDEDDE